MNKKDRKKSGNRKFILWTMLILIASPFVWLGWHDLWSIFLEKTPPQINITELPVGIGLTPTTLRFEVSDPAAGIDEILVRLRQRGRTFELFKQKYKRSKSETVQVELPSDPSLIIEGPLELELGAFDASFWNNRNLQTFQLKADYRKPYLDLISTQHNIRESGSQLVIYQVNDSNLAVHGVKVGTRAFLGVPMKLLDRAFSQANLFAALFSIDSLAGEPPKVRLFAEDDVGNGTSRTLPVRMLSARGSVETVKLNDNHLNQIISKLYAANYTNLLARSANAAEQKLPDPLDLTDQAGQLRAFEIVHKQLNVWSELELQRALKTFRDPRLWEEAFIPIPGTVISSFGNKLNFKFDQQIVFSDRQMGYELVPFNKQVLAANSGIVSVASKIGSFGQVLAIDHGLGLFSIYAWLGEFNVKVGDKVRAGQQIALTGQSGLGRGREYLYQIRLQGQPVDPREWSDKGWYYSHIVDKINVAKTKFGLPVLVGQLTALQ